MRRIRLVIEYDGSSYAGWQVQENGLAIQQVIESALFKLTGETVCVTGSGRTDARVHALAQVAHFDTASRIPADKFTFALNTMLPADIRVKYSDEVDENFHARFSAKQKHYRYTILLAPHAGAFTRNTALHVHTPLDINVMNEASKLLTGQHDFKAFMAANTKVKSTEREIYLSGWSIDGPLLYYDIAGSGFLYNMVRIIVGTMLEIGKGLLPVESISAALKSGNRSDLGATAPAKGLTLMRVVYDDFDTDEKIYKFDQ